MDRLDKLELITKRLMRRARKRATAIITPYPISNAAFGDNVKGSILRYMFPCDGVVTKGLIRFGAKPKKEVSVEVKIFNEQISFSKGFAIEKKLFSITPDFEVKTGDCLDIILNPNEENVSEVWVAFLWKPTVADVEAKSFLIADLEKALEIETQELLEEGEAVERIRTDNR